MKNIRYDNKIDTLSQITELWLEIARKFKFLRLAKKQKLYK